uniref:Uncharacterized protein n=1 Tax=Manihot esculenta TaxID=3983 RepID=A0A2C9UIV9_MANES
MEIYHLRGLQRERERVNTIKRNCHYNFIMLHLQCGPEAKIYFAWCAIPKLGNAIAQLKQKFQACEGIVFMTNLINFLSFS